MEPRISIITLGVDSLARSIAFYECLGFPRRARGNDGIAFFQLGALALALYPRPALAEDVGVPAEKAGFSGITLAYNARSRDEVTTVLGEAAAAGGSIVKPAQDVFWGGFSGYFADPDGHLWEVAHNPFLTLDPDGGVRLGK